MNKGSGDYTLWASVAFWNSVMGRLTITAALVLARAGPKKP
jgi:hypothetical protein